MNDLDIGDRITNVGLGELQVTDDGRGVLVARALGSCVAVCAHDRAARVAGMAHVVLPERIGAGTSDPGAKFAEDGVPLLIERMRERGVSTGNLAIKIVGGAQVIALSSNGSLPIGERNALAAEAAIKGLGLSVCAFDVGGTVGRTARLIVGSGRLVVSRTTGEDYEI